MRTNGAVTIDSRELVAALRHAGVQDVDGAPRRRAEYSTDASNYRDVPSAVVFPREIDEVAAVLRIATEHGVPLTARGGGTSTAGNSISSGIVLDFSRHLNRVHEVDPDARTAVVEPGAVLDTISAAGAPFELRFGPDPSSHARASIGGSIGNNSCGSRALRYGRTADNVVQLDVLTGGGVRFDARRYGKHGLSTHGSARDLLPAIDAVVRANLGVIRTEFGRLTRQVSGYSLEHLLPESGSDVARFLVGTEGTLAVVLGATVKLVQTPPAVALTILGYPDMPAAADAVPALLPHRPEALEGMDARLVDIVRRRRGAASVPDLPRGSGWLFVETSGATDAEARAAGEKLIADAGCLDAAVLSGAPARALWRIREDGAGLGSRTPDGRPAWPGWEDAAVPPERLGAYLREFGALLRESRLDALTYGHFGDGCVHARIDFPLAEDPGRYRMFVTAAAQLVARYGGSISGEHGDGRARGELLHYMYSADALAAFAQLKRAFDPANVLNPGVLVDPAPIDADLRVPLARPVRTHHGFAYPHDDGGFAAAVHRCIGVGKCRADNTDAGGVMCPSYLATRDARATTRGRARVLQEAVSGGAPGSWGAAAGGGSLVKGLRSDEVRESLDLCLACKGCSSDCPTGVDMATYKAEVLHERYRHRPRPPAHYALGWLPRWARLASYAPRLVNAALRNPALGPLVKRAGGMDARRALPSIARETFREWFEHWPGRTGTPVLLWVDTFTNYFDPDVGKAAVRVLEAAGYSVRITEKQVCCGLTWISTGQLEGARRRLRKSLGALDQAVRFGTPVVGLEPSCTAVLRGELPHLLPDDPRSAGVSAATVTLAELLAGTEGYVPPRLDGVRGVAQPHCHQHAVLGWHADAALLADAGAQVDAVGGCCGLAGNFGMERGHYDVSVAVAETALLPAVRDAPYDAVVLADGFSCRTQLEQLADAHSSHLAQLLDEHLADGPPALSAREVLRRQGVGGVE
jgi:FAD/FMN-containing dehydrogenase/Fe-S oxidoreductase